MAAATLSRFVRSSMINRPIVHDVTYSFSPHVGVTDSVTITMVASAISAAEKLSVGRLGSWRTQLPDEMTVAVMKAANVTLLCVRTNELRIACAAICRA